jgi:hypothetical protein
MSQTRAKDDVWQRPLTRFMSFTRLFTGTNAIVVTLAGGCREGGFHQYHKGRQSLALTTRRPYNNYVCLAENRLREILGYWHQRWGHREILDILEVNVFQCRLQGIHCDGDLVEGKIAGSNLIVFWLLFDFDCLLQMVKGCFR